MLLPLLMAGCGGSGSGGTATGGASKTAGTAAQPQSLSQLYAQAKKEGQVVFDGPPPAKYVQPVIALFEKTYPGVKVDYRSVGDQVVIPLITAQEAAGSVQIDLAGEAMSYFTALISSMAPVPWHDYGVPQSFVFQGNKAVHWFDTAWSLAYNTKLVKPQDVPHSWQDLLKPRWANGRIALDNGPTYADALLLSKSWGAKKALAFAKSLRAQKPLIEARPILVLQAVVSGQAQLGTTGSYLVLKAKAEGQPIDIAPVSPQTAPPVDLFVLKGARHPAAAELLASWLVSAKARQAFEKASYFGIASPCNASSMAAYLCKKHVAPVWFSSYAASTHDLTFRKQFNQALGIVS